MNIISVKTIIDLHTVALAMYGGLDGILYYATIEYLVDKCQYSNDPIEQAAILLHGISSMHPFEDGNKRTGVYAADVVLREYGLCLIADQDDVIRMGLALASYNVSLEDTISWLRENSGVIAQELLRRDYT
ncbi:type II toxin-antitoxin system death-on-curing family toxin [Methanospirillum sp.]|uniref:type II toxin-antitoxin system death-on-curing family toxin n=1 Tax=Methanospirillum sp. TaxID=45200 RepID=UPI0035A18680